MTVLAVVTQVEDAAPLVRWSARFARALGCRLVVLHPGRGVQPQDAVDVDLAAPSDHPVLRSVQDAALEVTTSFGHPAADGQETAPPPPITLRRVSHPDPLEAVLGEAAALDPALVVLPSWEGVAAAHDDQHLTQRLLARVDRDVVVLRAAAQSGAACGRILVPTAGGPHANVALRLAERMTRAGDGVLTALYVEPDAGDEDDAREVGLRQLRRALDEAGVEAGDRVRLQVVLSDRPPAGIAQVAPEHDLLLVGASDRGFAQRVLFGTLPDRLLSGAEGMAVAVLRRGRPAVLRPWDALRQAVERRLPRLSREARLELFETVQTGSRWSVDFMVLMALSTAIASLGLLQGSLATVIGAMLVAPMMTPIIGAGLGLVQGNLLLVRDATWAIVLGVLVALATGVLFGALHPADAPTADVLALGAPTLLDLLVATFSGAAAAYALARPGLSGALAGVAIAVSLEPPISAAGISFSKGAWAAGEGAALLFGTNLVAIIVGAAAVFIVVGVRASKEHSRSHVWGRRALVGLVLLAAALAVPLGSMLLARLAEASGPAAFKVTEELTHRLDERLRAGREGLTLVSVERVGTLAAHDLRLVVAVQGRPSPDLARELARAAREVVPPSVHVEVVCLECAWASSAQ